MAHNHHPPIETRHDGDQGNLTPFTRSVIVDDGKRIVAVQDVIDSHVQLLWMSGLELETAAKVQADIGRHLVVVHGGEVVQGVLLPKEGHRWILACGNRLPMAGLERE